MYKLNYFRFLIFISLMLKTYSAIKFNGLEEKLVSQLIKLKSKTSVVASALMVRFPLCKLAAVATGEAKTELMTVLGYKDESMLNTCYSDRLKECIKALRQSDLTQVNRIYLNYTDDIDPNFLVNASERFGVTVQKVGFYYPNAALAYINRGIITETYKRLTDVLDANDINKNTKMIIVNAIHFKGTWEFPFDFRLTKMMQFRHFDNKISKIPMMTKAESFFYTATSDIKLLSIKFASWRASITFVVPNSAQGLPDLLGKLENDPNLINNLVKKMTAQPMRVLLPRFKVKTYVDWTGFLQELGLYSIFNTDSTDLSGILKETSALKKFNLHKIKQKIFVQIDELGVARFTRDPYQEVGPQPIPGFLEVPIFSADKPFYFQITLDFQNIRYELFNGVYYGPEPSAMNL